LQAVGTEGGVGRELWIHVAPLGVQLTGGVEDTVRIVGQAALQNVADALGDPIAASKHAGSIEANR